MLRKNEIHKENVKDKPSSSAKEKVEEFRREFFNKAANGSKEQVSVRPFNGLDIENICTPAENSVK